MNADMTIPEALEASRATEDLLRSFPNLGASFSICQSGRFSASCYWPNGDVLRDIGCHGIGLTLADAITDMEAKVEAAKAKGKQLKTASECKEAVIALIREHDAAPASFRDAVDALPVAK